MSGNRKRVGSTSVREFADTDDVAAFMAGVSLHAHTHHSRESLTDFPYFMERIPLFGKPFERELRTRMAQGDDAVDFSKVWWHPPVTSQTVFDSELDQIERRFGLPALISVTDHDDIAAGLDLQTLYAVRRAPVSFEWTVPIGRGFFHLGVHNLPPASAEAWFARLTSITTRPSE